MTVTAHEILRAEPSTAAALFERCAHTYPTQTAVEDDRCSLTYRELNAQANRLARRLVVEGVGADQVVAVAVPRSVDCVVALLAVLKSGAAYLPLDLTYPPERLAFMVRDAHPVLALTTMTAGRQFAAAAGDLACLELDQSETAATLASLSPEDVTDAERTAAAHPDHAMYVIYTSGSTGIPKGVVVTGAGMAALADTQRRTLRAGPGSRVLQWASISFDAAFWDISAALFSGATLVLAPGDRAVPDGRLHDLLRDGRITHATLPPAVLAALDDDVLAGATIVSTGDSCTEQIARRWARGRRLLNGYGPTETTVGATISEPFDGDGVPIGRPFTDTAVHLLDDSLRPVRPGEIGEIYVGGPGLARCYLGQPALTAQRFVASPFGSGRRLYRTGDLASVADDGQLVFRGRADDQVKIRGFRVEPGEAESVLGRHPQVRQAAVVVRDDEHLGKQLAAYVVTDGCGPEELRAYLERTLPDYLVPAAIVDVPAIPLTPNGKVDREALPSPSRGATAGQRKMSAHEEYLCASVAELLGVEQVGPDDDFFALGGHSLLAATLIRRIRSDLGVRLPVRKLYQSSRISEIATSLDEAKPAVRQENDTGREL
jgi:amino acid adenylation domain-containing protein